MAEPVSIFYPGSGNLLPRQMSKTKLQSQLSSDFFLRFLTNKAIYLCNILPNKSEITKGSKILGDIRKIVRKRILESIFRRYQINYSTIFDIYMYRYCINSVYIVYRYFLSVMWVGSKKGIGPERSTNNNNNKTDHLISARRPDLIIINKKKRELAK